MEQSLGQHYVQDAIGQFKRLKSQVEKSIAQVTDAELFTAIDPESNSIAVIMKHINGNQRSRWTDFLTSDGEKPDRNRDDEFEMGGDETRESLLKSWEDGWNRLFNALAPLAEEDLMRTVTIRGQAHTVVQAINRQLTHYGEHTGQIVFLAKHFRAGQWKSLSIPRGKSEEFDRTMTARETPQGKTWP